MSHGHKHKHHITSIAALLLGIAAAAAGLVHQFYLEEPIYHPLAGYVLVFAGGALFLRCLRPPIGFIRLLTTLIGGACLGACPMFYQNDSADVPWICVALILVGAALLGGSFTVRNKMHHHH